MTDIWNKLTPSTIYDIRDKLIVHSELVRIFLQFVCMSLHYFTDPMHSFIND